MGRQSPTVSCLLEQLAAARRSVQVGKLAANGERATVLVSQLAGKSAFETLSDLK